MIPDALAALALIATTFAATNVDNLALLLGWLLSREGGRGPIVVGYALGMLGLLLFAGAFGMGAALIPVERVGYLGLIPIAMGLRGLYGAWRSRPDSVSVASDGVAARTRPAIPLAIAATQIANGVDTVLVFGPLLADSEDGVDFVMAIGFVFMAGIWFSLARFLERHATRLPAIERYGHWLAPALLIVIGSYILANTGTDVMPGD